MRHRAAFHLWWEHNAGPHVMGARCMIRMGVAGSVPGDATGADDIRTEDEDRKIWLGARRTGPVLDGNARSVRCRGRTVVVLHACPLLDPLRPPDQIGADERLDPAGKRFYGISVGPVRFDQIV